MLVLHNIFLTIYIYFFSTYVVQVYPPTKDKEFGQVMSICIYQAPPVQLQNLFFDARVHCLVLEPQYLKFGTIPRHWLVTNRPFQNCISHWYATNIIEVAVISIGTDQFGRNYGRRKLKTSLKRRRRSIDYKRTIFGITNRGSIKQTSSAVVMDEPTDRMCDKAALLKFLCPKKQ